MTSRPPSSTRYDQLMRLVPAHELRALVSMSDAVEAMREAFALTTLRRGQQPSRLALEDGSALVMLAEGPGSESLVAKVVTVRPANRAIDLPSLHAVVILFDG